MVAKKTAKKTVKKTTRKAAPTPKLADAGVVGLAVMGENLILNMESKGFTVACFNRTKPTLPFLSIVIRSTDPAPMVSVLARLCMM